MKTILLLTFFFYCSVSRAQFSESFFENLLPSDAPRGHFGGCVTTDNGVLGVRFAYQGTTEVQWVKLDQYGDYQFYSSNLPQDSISNVENIVEVFEEGNFQYIITQNAESTDNFKGFHFYKFENYSTLVFSSFIPQLIKNVKSSIYYRYGKFYLLFNQIPTNLILIKVDPVSFSIVDTDTLSSNISVSSIPNYTYYGNSFIKFYDENNYDVYSKKDTMLVRIKNINSQIQAPEYFDLDVSRVLGFNQEETTLAIYQNLSKKIVKYYLDSLLTYVGELNISNIPVSNNPMGYLIFHSNGSKDFIINENQKLYLYDNHQLIDSNINQVNYRINKIEFNQNKYILIGSKEMAFSKYFLSITSNSFDKIFEFKEYGGKYKFGNYKTHLALGNSIFFNVEDRLREKDFIFNDKIYISGQMISGKSNSSFYGQNKFAVNGAYKPGPYTNPALYDVSVVDRYNENFYVTEQMLNEHVNAINNADPSYRMPKGIKNWPANGDVSKGQVGNLAPFVDVNNNGVYEPLFGDFPSFPGTNCLLNITHQLESDFNNTGSGLEVHTYMYNFDCMDSIKDVIFIKTQVFNRGTIEFDSLAYGIYNDFDLGYYGDDYIGTHVNKGLIYAYNGDLIDEQGPNSFGFGDSLPTMANMFLKGVPFSHNGIDDMEGVSEFQTINGFGFNDSVLDNEYRGLEYSTNFRSGNNDPNNPQGYFYYLNGRLLDGNPQFYGGDGTALSTGATEYKTKYMFPGNSDSNFYGTSGIDPGFIWDEMTTNNPQGDRRIMGSFGSTPLAPGESITYHSAYLAGKRVPGMGQSEMDLFAKAAHVKKAFNTNITSCGQTFDNLTEDQITSVPKKHKEIDFKIYPNPMDELVSIELSDVNASGKITFVDINGKICLQTELKGKANPISVKDLPNGFYIVKIQSKQGTRQYKLVKK